MLGSTIAKNIEDWNRLAWQAKDRLKDAIACFGETPDVLYCRIRVERLDQIVVLMKAELKDCFNV